MHCGGAIVGGLAYSILPAIDICPSRNVISNRCNQTTAAAVSTPVYPSQTESLVAEVVVALRAPVVAVVVVLLAPVVVVVAAPLAPVVTVVAVPLTAMVAVMEVAVPLAAMAVVIEVAMEALALLAVALTLQVAVVLVPPAPMENLLG